MLVMLGWSFGCNCKLVFVLPSNNVWIDDNGVNQSMIWEIRVNMGGLEI